MHPTLAALSHLPWPPPQGPGGVQSLGEEGSDPQPAGRAPCSLLGSGDRGQRPRVLPLGTSWALVPSADGDRECGPCLLQAGGPWASSFPTSWNWLGMRVPGTQTC